MILIFDLDQFSRAIFKKCPSLKTSDLDQTSRSLNIKLIFKIKDHILPVVI